jgi:hypothetical protein
MSELYRAMKNRTPPMVVRIHRKRHICGPMAPRPAPRAEASEPSIDGEA